MWETDLQTRKLYPQRQNLDMSRNCFLCLWLSLLSLNIQFILYPSVKFKDGLWLWRQVGVTPNMLEWAYFETKLFSDTLLSLCIPFFFLLLPNIVRFLKCTNHFSNLNFCWYDKEATIVAIAVVRKEFGPSCPSAIPKWTIPLRLHYCWSDRLWVIGYGWRVSCLSWEWYSLCLG